MKENKKRKTGFAQVRHAFLYKVVKGDGTSKVHKAWARVRHATQEVELVLTAEHVRKSIAAKGAGDTSKCTMAVCTYNHAGSFPHKVEGHLDWNYSRAWVVSKCDKVGLPCECVAYEHNDRGIARLNDSPNGQKQLLQKLERD